MVLGREREESWDRSPLLMDRREEGAGGLHGASSVERRDRPWASVSPARDHRARSMTIPSWAMVVIGLLALILSIPAIQHVQTGRSNPGQGSFVMNDPAAMGKEGMPPLLPNNMLFSTERSDFISIHVGRVGPVKGLLYFEIPQERLEETFVVNAMYSRANGETSLLHSSAETEKRNWFAFRRAEAFPEAYLELYRPELEVRLTENNSELKRAYEEGAFAGKIAMYRYIQNPVTGALIIDVTRWMMERFLIINYPPGMQGLVSFVSANAFPRNLRIECDDTRFLLMPDEIAVNPMIRDSIRLEFSISQLPKVQMKPRRSDTRVGFFTFTFFSLDHPDVPNPKNDMISRWRMEKLDPSKAKSDVKQPIIFHIDPSIPERYWKYMRDGVERWQPAFEELGYLNAIRARLPTDPDWPKDYMAGDVRYPSVSWSPSLWQTVAIGPSHVDPRSGEILHANIIFTHSWIRAWLGEIHIHSYEGFASQDRERSSSSLSDGPERDLISPILGRISSTLRQNVPIDMDFIGAGLAVTLSHEVGHTLGLRHNFRASADVPFEKILDSGYVEKNGFAASVMDYIHPVFLPESKNQRYHFSPVIGPYDFFAIRYGYAQVKDDKELTSIAEDGFAKGLHFATDEDDPSPSGIDPLATMWDLSDDPLSFYELEVQNVKDMLPKLLQRAISENQDWGDFTFDATRLLLSAARSLENAAKFIGGESVSRGRGPSSTPRRIISAKDQTRALDMILREFDIKNGLFGIALIRDYGRYFVVHGGECGLGESYCYGEPAVDHLALMRALRSGALQQITDIRRMHRLESHAVALSANKSNDVNQVGLAQVLRKISDEFLNGSVSEDYAHFAQDTFSQWLFSLKRVVDTTKSLTGRLIQAQSGVRGTPGPLPVNFGTVRIAVIGELNRLRDKVETMSRHAKGTGVDEEYFSGALSVLRDLLT